MKRIAVVALALLALAGCRQKPVIERVPDSEYTSPSVTPSGP